MPAPDPYVELKEITKSFGGTPVLAGVSLSLFSGEVQALLGENGAGKSTLVKILAGLHEPETGFILLERQIVQIRSPVQSRQAGIAVIHQEPSLFPDLSIAENIFMGRQPKRRFGRIDYEKMHESVAEVIARLGVKLNPKDPVLGLSLADQQIVEIAKALAFEAKVLIMDEPTASLSTAEVDRLFGVVGKLRQQNVAVLFISHRLEEVFAIAQRLTIMRDGQIVDTDLTENFTAEQVIRKMVGRSLQALYPKELVEPGEMIFSARNLRKAGVFRDISFAVRAGEIVALAGLVGAGRSEVARAIFGIDLLDEGEITIGHLTLTRPTPHESMQAGIGFVPEDRQHQGLVMDLSALQNATLTILNTIHRFGLIEVKKQERIAAHWTDRMNFKGHLKEPVRVLSGGNQQKVVLAKWLATKPKFLIVDEPTRGIDVGAKAEVHRTLTQLAKEGLGILMISSDLPEVLGMADRILVMHEGKLAATLSRREATEERIMTAATGQGPH